MPKILFSFIFSRRDRGPGFSERAVCASHPPITLCRPREPANSFPGHSSKDLPAQHGGPPRGRHVNRHRSAWRDSPLCKYVAPTAFFLFSFFGNFILLSSAYSQATTPRSAFGTWRPEPACRSSPATVANTMSQSTQWPFIPPSRSSPARVQTAS